jgi:mRNA interferase YafQ
MLEIRYSAKFKRDFKTIVKRGYNPDLLQEVLEILCNGQPLPPQYK